MTPVLGTAKNIVYFGDWDGNLYSYNQKSKDKLKKVAKADRWIRSIAVLDDIAYFGSNSGNIYSYNPKTGERSKVAQSGDRIKSMTALDGKLYFSGTDFCSYNPRTERQNIEKAYGGFNCMTALGGLLYGGSGGRLYSYNPKKKKQKMLAEIDGQISCITKLDGKLYFGSDDRDVYSYDPKTRELDKVAQSYNKIKCITAFGGELYFSGTDFCSYNPKTKEQKVVKTDDPRDCLAGLGERLYSGSWRKFRGYNLRGKGQDMVATISDGPVSCICTA